MDARLAGSIAFADALEGRRHAARTPVELNGDDLLFLQYTGGTTGLSKGACLSHRNLVANTEQFKAFMPDAVRPGQEVIVTAIPLYHIFALMVNFITYFSVGADNWLVANPRDMDGFIDTHEAGAAERLHGRQHALRRPGRAPAASARSDFSNLRLSGGGGAAVVGATSGEVEGDHRQLHPRRLRPVGDLARSCRFNPLSMQRDSPAPPGLPLPSHRHQAARRRRRGSRHRPVRRDLRQGPAGDERLLATSPRPMPRRSPPTATSAPATSACSTTRAS